MTRVIGRWKPELTIARSTRCAAFLDRRLGQADDDLFRQAAGRDVHLDLDRQGVDPDQGIRLEFGEHEQVPSPSGRGLG